jgi:hypothetical protein
MDASSSMKHSLRSNEGQTLIELALIFPLMLALVYGAIEIGSVISTYLTITHTAREGANLTSRGTPVATALLAIKTAADPTIRDDNTPQWRIIYSKIKQPVNPPPCPPKPCRYIVEDQIPDGGFNQPSKIGAKGQNITLSGVEDLEPGQTFHAIEVYYDYTPNVMTYVGNLINKTFYERAIFTNVSDNW